MSRAIVIGAGPVGLLTAIMGISSSGKDSLGIRVYVRIPAMATMMNRRITEVL